MRPHGGIYLFIKDWKQEVLTIPNGLSFFRLLLIPVYTTIYLNAQNDSDYRLAAIILATSCMTDMFDGMIARQFNMVSNVGKVLDPLADKLTQLALTICLSIRYPVLRGVLVLLIGKEFIQVIMAYHLFRQGKILSGPLLSGKICTAVLFTSFIIFMLIPSLPLKIVTTIALLDCFVLAVAFIQYFFTFIGKHQQLLNFEE